MKRTVTTIQSSTENELTESERYIVDKIKQSDRFAGWTLYEKPHLNSMRPDFILTHPQKGVLLIEVRDWSLKAPEYLREGQVKGATDKYYTDNPVKQITTYKNLILKYELDSFLEAVESHGKQAFDMMTPIVYFHHAGREDALNFVGEVDPSTCLIWTKKDLDDLTSDEVERDDDRFPSSVFIDRSKFTRGPEKSLQHLVQNLTHLLDPSTEVPNYKRRLTLTPEQYRLVPVQKGSIRRWGGVAGSGKTAVIATKAADAITRGERVLVLTYNITLRHYLRDLCQQQFVGNDRNLLKSHLTISHFHGFLKVLIAELGLNVPETSVETQPKWAMEAVLEKRQTDILKHLQYDSIFIDEGQDFSGDWLRFLKNIYTEQGELLVMYDEAQSMYEEQGVWIKEPEEIAGLGFKGQVGHLSITHRLPNGIVHQIDRLSDVFGIDKRLNATSEQIDLFTDIDWQNVEVNANRIPLIQEKINTILEKNVSTAKDITIITMNEETGIEVVKAFEDSAWKVSHVYDVNETEAESKRRNEKWMFQPDKDRLKVASYHSYKGWESSHVILLLEGIENESKQWKHMLDALYISLTRVSAFSNSRSFTCINNCCEFDKIGKYFE